MPKIFTNKFQEIIDFVCISNNNFRRRIKLKNSDILKSYLYYNTEKPNSRETPHQYFVHLFTFLRTAWKLVLLWWQSF